MEVHLRELFDAFQQQFGVAPGLGRGSGGGNLSSIEGLSIAFLKSVFRAAAALYKSNPWKKLKPADILGLKIGKDADWPESKSPFHCVQFIGSGDPSLNLFRSEDDAISCMTGKGYVNPTSVPRQGFLRVVFGPESELSNANRKLIKQLGLAIAGPKAYPLIDVVYSSGKSPSPSFRLPTLEELRWLFASLRALEQAHPLMQVSENKESGRAIEDGVQYIDIQWPAEDRKEWDITCVKISCPPKEEQQTEMPKLFVVPERELDILASPRKCIVCEKEVAADQASRCSRCKAVIYCSHMCQKKHWKESHKSNCEHYKAAMEQEDELEFKGFGFPCLIHHSCRWLELTGLHEKGMWRRMCSCLKRCPFGLLPPPSEGNPWGLQEGMYPPNTPLSTSILMPALQNWFDYYELRELPEDSPVAAILSFPLTLYYILTVLSPYTKSMLSKNKEVIVHYIGPEAELDWMPAFTELAYLLHGTGSLHILMIGPDVPGSLTGMTEVLKETLKVTYIQGLYQEKVDSIPTPHITVGFNCSFESDGSWMGALEVIKVLGFRGFFTDYAETCWLNGRQALRGAGLQVSFPLTVNPFRSPVRKQMPCVNVPWFSNGFLLGVNT